MKKILIGRPLSWPMDSLLTNILIFLPTTIVTAALFYQARAQEGSDQLTSYGVGIFFLLVIVFQIWSIFSHENLHAEVNKKGIKIKNDGEKTEIKWENIEEMRITFAIHRIGDTDRKEGFPYLLLKLKNFPLPIKEKIITRRKTTVPFFANSSYFKNFLGDENNFDIAINFENVKEKESKGILTDYPLKPMRTRPLIEVKTKDEYNKVIEEICAPKEQEEYKLK